MDRYSLIVVGDELSPIRRFDVRRDNVRRACWGAGIAVLVLLLGIVDYVRLRIDHTELEGLRIETSEQREKIEAFDASVAAVDSKLAHLGDLERKIRVIANLPGSVAAGGADVVEVGNGTGGDLDASAMDATELPPAVDGEAEAAPEPAVTTGPRSDPAAPVGDRVSALRRQVEKLGHVADARGLSLLELIQQLENKQERLASSPAIWPAKGWLTSRFGNRISPFTHRRQFHAGLDIAAARGTEIVATADAKVAFVGPRGPLGNAVILDHGYGVRTMYGHTNETFVKRGEKVHRGQKIATVGNTGRSTGPHLHYVVEVNGKARNPLDYIFD
jgi:murein DD-endopeptidase MepM/ murein hydrolase activator NlpD